MRAAENSFTTIDEVGEMICQSMDVRPRFTYDGNHGAGVSRQWSLDLSHFPAPRYEARINMADGLAKRASWFRQDQGQTVCSPVKAFDSPE